MWLPKTHIRGNRLANAPEYTASFGGRFHQPITDTLQLTLSGELRYEDESFTDSSNNPDFVKESATLVNGRIGIESISGRWRLSFWGKNIFDEEYQEDGNDFFGLAQQAYLSNPQTYGVELRLKL
ncbi:MAG: TonB-dependent receptor [Deltaproteobacteria bacterium]|nr:TonB-dependent receptor [Deltaproteobacteria bacterium]